MDIRHQCSLEQQTGTQIPACPPLTTDTNMASRDSTDHGGLWRGLVQKTHHSPSLTSCCSNQGRSLFFRCDEVADQETMAIEESRCWKYSSAVEHLPRMHKASSIPALVVKREWVFLCWDEYLMYLSLSSMPLIQSSVHVCLSVWYGSHLLKETNTLTATLENKSPP